MGTDLNWKELFFGFQGRISRKPFWLASLALAAAGFGAIFAGSFLIAVLAQSVSLPTELLTILFLAAIAFLLFCSLAISVKRLHDRGKSGWWMALYYGVSGVQAAAEQAGYSGTAENPTEIGIVLAVIGLVVGVWYLIDLGFLKGTPGPNHFGPDPLGGTQRQTDASF